MCELLTRTLGTRTRLTRLETACAGRSFGVTLHLAALAQQRSVFDPTTVYVEGVSAVNHELEAGF